MTSWIQLGIVGVVYVVTVAWFASRMSFHVETLGARQTEVLANQKESAEKADEFRDTTIEKLNSLVTDSAVSKQQYATVIGILELHSKEIASLREWRHDFAGKEMIYDSYKDEIAKLWQEVRRFNRGDRPSEYRNFDPRT